MASAIIFGMDYTTASWFLSTLQHWSLQRTIRSKKSPVNFDKRLINEGFFADNQLLVSTWWEGKAESITHANTQSRQRLVPPHPPHFIFRTRYVTFRSSTSLQISKSTLVRLSNKLLTSLLFTSLRYGRITVVQ